MSADPAESRVGRALFPAPVAADSSGSAPPALASAAGVGSLDEIGPSRLRQMAAAASELRECQRLLAKSGLNVVGEVLYREAEFTEWSHFPDGDVYDPQSHAQYYYHAHPPEDRPFHEHGHFHLFLRSEGMPDGVVPSPGQEPPADGSATMSHIAAISMDPFGLPIRLFTTNRWVTGDVWHAAPDVIRMLDAFEIDMVRPNQVVNRWITAIVRLFRPQIEFLLHERDRTITAWKGAAPGMNVFEDRRLDVTSSLDISIDTQIAAVLGAAADLPGGGRDDG